MPELLHITLCIGAMKCGFRLDLFLMKLNFCLIEDTDNFEICWSGWPYIILQHCNGPSPIPFQMKFAVHVDFWFVSPSWGQIKNELNKLPNSPAFFFSSSFFFLLLLLLFESHRFLYAGTIFHFMLEPVASELFNKKRSN